MTIFNYTSSIITDAGGTININVDANLDGILLVPATNPLLMSANIALNFVGTPLEGQSITVGWADGFQLNGNTFTINGVSVTDLMALNEGQIQFFFISGNWGNTYSPDLRLQNTLSGSVLAPATVALDKLANVTDGSIVAGGAGNVPTELTVAGVLSAVRSAATLVYSYVAGSITNAAISASAAIDRRKLATGTASQVVVNDGSGVMTSVAEVPPVNGGTGQDTSASTGFATVSAGTWSVGAISEVITVPVSWESGEQCNNRVKIPFAGTVTNIYAVVTKALSGTDAGTIVPKNAASTNMTLASALSFAASSALETAIDTNVSANNTVAAGDIIYLTTAKTTVGGKALVSITITRES